MELERKKIQRALYFVVYALLPVGIFYLMEAYEHNALLEVRTEAQFFNIFIFELLAWIIYLAIGHMCAAARVILGIAMAFGITNHYVMKFRSTPFVPWDIFSVRTATSVAENYDFTPDLRMVIVTLIFIAAIVLSRFLKKAPKIKLQVRLGTLLVSVLVTCLFVNTLQKEDFQTKHYLYPFLFTPAYMTEVNGMAVTFAMNLAYVVVDKPQGYSAEDAKKTLESYEKTEDTKQDTQDLPNIIVIMDEAFSDLAVLGDLQTNEDYMPFMHKMQQGQKNTITGYAQVSVCGGNTANSEFEFLTGDTMAFLPSGSIAYQQYIKQDTPSLASYLKSLGYATYAQHPYYANGWDRERVYPLLGFEHMDFIEDYTNVSYVRKYISDASDMQHIIDTYEKKEAGKPAFIFNVTMQNHGGYTDVYPNFENDIQAQYNSDALNQYLSLIHKTDAALEDLVSYFSKVDEKTVIVFFGDHQPSDAVANQIEMASGVDPSDMNSEQQKKRYQVPYLVWANYDIGEASDQNTSLNYLSAQVLKAAGVPTSAYQNYFLELSNTYPVLSAAGSTENVGANKDALLTYRKLQYYNLFERNK
ncbi:MAG: sulfatase [Roseburia sp. CAG:197_41_10]|nr:MAG: sulfatase [Roseburia sp. CAG:197_41_10]